MKRILTLALALILVLGATFSFSSCGKGSDWEAVKEDGYFVCGITVAQTCKEVDYPCPAPAGVSAAVRKSALDGLLCGFEVFGGGLGDLGRRVETVQV